MHVKFTHKIILGRNLEILLLLNSGRDRSFTAATVSNTNQFITLYYVEPGSDLIGSLYL